MSFGHVSECLNLMLLRCLAYAWVYRSMQDQQSVEFAGSALVGPAHMDQRTSPVLRDSSKRSSALAIFTRCAGHALVTPALFDQRTMLGVHPT